jgi:TP901 family phage tail tape measure protein
VLAQASRTANVDVEMLGQTMKFVAPAVAAVGGSLQETAALAGVLGDAGIQATMAGTMLRSSYLRLAAPAKAGTNALSKMRTEMGISAEEMPDVAKEAMLAQKRLAGMGVAIFQDGKMRSMVDILKDMSVALKDASDQEKLAAVKDIFGTRAASGALTIFKSIETGRLDEVVDKLNNANGVAKEMADRLKNTTIGSFKQFGSAMESVGISIGSVLLPAFTDIALGAAEVASWVSAMADKFPLVTKVIGLTVAGLVSFKIAAIATGYAWTFIKGGFLVAKGAIIAFRSALVLAQLTMTSTKFTGIIAGVLAFGRTIWGVTLGAVPALITAIRGMNLAFMTSPIGLIISAIATGAGLIIYYWKPIAKFFANLLAPIIDLFSGVFGWVGTLWEQAKNIFAHVKQWLTESWVGKVWGWVTGSDEEREALEAEANANKPPELGNTVKELEEGADQPPTRENISRLPNPNHTPTAEETTITINAPINIYANASMNEQEIASQVKLALKQAMQEATSRKRAINYDHP